MAVESTSAMNVSAFSAASRLRQMDRPPRSPPNHTQLLHHCHSLAKLFLNGHDIESLPPASNLKVEESRLSLRIVSPIRKAELAQTSAASKSEMSGNARGMWIEVPRDLVRI
jgi:hypothetical protein